MNDEHNPQKKVDESWKEQVEAERSEKPEEKPETGQEEQIPGQVNFQIFTSTLAMQAYIALGELEDPVSRQKKVHLPQAKYMIDIITLLRDKTKGNLTADEDKMVSQLLYDLQLKYVEKSETP